MSQAKVLGIASVLWAFGCGSSNPNPPGLPTGGPNGLAGRPGSGPGTGTGGGGGTAGSVGVGGAGGANAGAAGVAGAGAPGTGGGAACPGDPLTRCTGTMMGAWCTETVTPGGLNSFSTMWANRPDDVWFVGGDFSRGIVPDGTGMYAHFDGCAWTVTPRPDLPQLNGVWGAAPNDVWIVGTSSNVYHWDGATLTAFPVQGASYFKSVHGTSSTDVWAAGSGIFHWDGITWTQMSASPGNDVWAVAPGDAWVASGTTDALHFTGATFSTTTLTDFGLFSIWSDGTQTYAGGEGEALFRFAGGTWTTLQGRGGSSEGFVDIGGLGGDVFAVGNGMVVRLSGTTFTPIPDPPSPPFFRTIWVSPTQTWLGAGNGFVARRVR